MSTSGAQIVLPVGISFGFFFFQYLYLPVTRSIISSKDCFDKPSFLANANNSRQACARSYALSAF